MLVVTIANWRRKLVWLLAALLLMTVIVMGQFAFGRSSAGRSAGTPTRSEWVEPTAQERGVWEGLVVKLRQYYQGQFAGRVK
ncbi:MAG: hypothetical protein ACPL5F_11975 [Moorellaceae bacterium]